MIKIYGAAENNLKNININIPLNKITTIIGVSGSGKSSLIFNVIANESLRLEKIDSGKANRLDISTRSKFKEIIDLPYCVLLKQRSLSESISSTIATITRLHELLRYEFVQKGKIIGDNGSEIQEPTIDEIQEFILKFYPDNDFKYYALIIDNSFTNGVEHIEFLIQNGIKEAIFISSFDQKRKLRPLKGIQPLNTKYSHTVILPINSFSELKKFEKLALCNFLIESQDFVLKFNTDFFDIASGKIYQKKSSHLLSFNSTDGYSGKCISCNGHGNIQEIDIENIFLEKKLNEHFLNLEINEKGCYKYIMLCQDSIDKFLKKENIDSNQSFFCLSKEQQELILNFISSKILQHQNRPTIGKFVKTINCPMCKGTRLNYKANAVKLFDINISELLEKTIDDAYDFFVRNNCKNHKILSTLNSLKDSSLGYLSLDRPTNSLSGGELQRLKFAIELNGEYKNLLYILDEPSTALHSYNNNNFIKLIKKLRDKGNTIIISDHDARYIKASDHVIELGPGSGDDGGYVIYEGYPSIIKPIEFIRDKIDIDLKNSLNLYHVNINNIVNQNFIIPLNCLVTISGVSGSGKSSLINKALVPCIKQYLSDKTYNSNIIKNITNLDKIRSVVELTQSQIGINSRSIVATYLNIFDDIRETYALEKTSKQFGLDKSHFSFNTRSGACDVCNGLGLSEENICPACLGQRYKPEILSVEYNNLNIYEFLNTPVKKLVEFIASEKILFAIHILCKLGLSHIQLGRITSTLSGGEAQRIKLANVLIDSFRNIEKGGHLFVFDEPTTGLNDKDIFNLYHLFSELIQYNNSIIVIEHNLNFIKNSDFIIDIGVGSGAQGGVNIFSGEYDDLIKNMESITSQAIKGEFPKERNLKYEKCDLKEKIYNSPAIIPNCNPFYLSNEHFGIEKEFAENYVIDINSESQFHFKNKQDLIMFVSSYKIEEIYFNPYTSDLFKYSTVPFSLKKERLKNLIQLGFNISIKDALLINEWDFRVEATSIEDAYNFGKGWITIVYNGVNIELSTRLINREKELVGSSKITQATFNLYCNSCNYCGSDGYLNTYNLNLIIKNASVSIFDKDFLYFTFKNRIKSVVNKFSSEGLFDFNKPFSELTQHEKNIFIFGFKEYKFLKPGGKVTTLSDYLVWEGLNNYLTEYLEYIDNGQDIKNSLHSIPCPFCTKGFNNEVIYYNYNGKNITEYLI